jgi:LuxR family maltose regulon positive regulatory protein
MLPLRGDPGVAHQASVALVCAPAGYGKTMLLADWAQQALLENIRVAWVSLDPDDNDPYVLWSAILRSLETASPDLEALRHLSPPQDPSERGFVAEVLETIGAAHERVTLVLDDVHELRDERCLGSLDALLRRMPEGLRVVLACRSEPSLSLHRLRLDGELAELRGENLAFTAAEAQDLLVQQSVDLRTQDLQALLDRTEGWAAALRIAAAALRGRSTPSDIIRAFQGDDRALADYLVAEVLERQTPDLRDFLFATCAPERLSADLARHLSSRPDAGGVLDDLERGNTLIVRLGQRDAWYRYHALLRGYLQAEAYRRDPDALKRQHAATATWLESHGAPSEAMTHAAAARDPELLCRLLRTHVLHLLLGGQGSLLRHHVDRLPETMADPAVAVLLALAAVDAGDAAEADRCLQHVDEQSFAEDRGRVLHAVARVARALLGGDVSESLARSTPRLRSPRPTRTSTWSPSPTAAPRGCGSGSSRSPPPTSSGR